MNKASGAKGARRTLSINTQKLPREDGRAEGVAQNTISKLLRGPAESDAIAGKPSTTK
jgi:hypothetical protein